MGGGGGAPIDVVVERLELLEREFAELREARLVRAAHEVEHADEALHAAEQHVALGGLESLAVPLGALELRAALVVRVFDRAPELLERVEPANESSRKKPSATFRLHCIVCIALASQYQKQKVHTGSRTLPARTPQSGRVRSLLTAAGGRVDATWRNSYRSLADPSSAAGQPTEARFGHHLLKERFAASSLVPPAKSFPAVLAVWNPEELALKALLATEPQLDSEEMEMECQWSSIGPAAGLQVDPRS